MYSTILTFIRFNNFGTRHLNGPRRLFRSFCCTTWHFFEPLHVYKPNINTDKYGTCQMLYFILLLLLKHVILYFQYPLLDSWYHFVVSFSKETICMIQKWLGILCVCLLCICMGKCLCVCGCICDALRLLPLSTMCRICRIYVSYWNLLDWFECYKLDRKRARVTLSLSSTVCTVQLSYKVKLAWRGLACCSRVSREWPRE